MSKAETDLDHLIKEGPI